MSDLDPTVIPDAPAPGWPQKLITAGIALLGALPSSGLFGPSSTVLKVAGLAVIALAAVGYGNHSATLKKAHAAGVAAGSAS